MSLWTEESKRSDTKPELLHERIFYLHQTFLFNLDQGQCASAMDKKTAF